MSDRDVERVFDKHGLGRYVESVTSEAARQAIAARLEELHSTLVEQAAQLSDSNSEYPYH